MKSAGQIMLAAPLAAGCWTITNTPESTTSNCCRVFEPIYVSPEDTKGQVYEHNAIYEEICGGSAEGEKTVD